MTTVIVPCVVPQLPGLVFCVGVCVPEGDDELIRAQVAATVTTAAAIRRYRIHEEN